MELGLWAHGGLTVSCGIHVGCVKRFSHWVTRGRIFDVSVKNNMEVNGGNF